MLCRRCPCSAPSSGFDFVLGLYRRRQFCFPDRHSARVIHLDHRIGGSSRAQRPQAVGPPADAARDCCRCCGNDRPS